jgi:hypothetical protein
MICIAIIAIINQPIFAASVPGHVEAWGANSFGQAAPPAGLIDVVAIAGGGDHSLALRSNGTVVVWGSNSGGQADIPPGLNNVIAISAAGHNVALRSDGAVVVWGNNIAAVTTVPAAATGATAISAGNTVGNSYTVAVRSNGTVIAWGVPPSSSTTNVPPGLTGVIAVAAGNNHVLALKNDGTVIAWGDNFAGAATPPPGLNAVVAVRAGQGTSFAIKSDGTVVGWGSAVVPPGLNGIIDLQDGATHTIALRTNGQVIAWGNNFVGQGTVPDGLSDVTAIAAGGNHNLALTPRPLILSLSPSITANIGDTVPFAVSATAGSLTYQWQRNGANLPNATNASITLTNVQASDAGAYRVLVRNAYGSVLSSPIALTFPPPIITTQPQSITRYRGESATFGVVANGIQPFSYQWRKGGTNIPGATSDTLTLPSVRTTNAGGYEVVITDGAGGNVTSSTATLTVSDPTLPQSVSLTPTLDTSISSGGANPQGTASVLAGRRRNGVTDRGLLRFNLTTIPSNAVVQSARVQLTVTRVPRSPANSDFSLYRMLRPWGIDASWTAATGGSPWASPGASSGSDFAATASARRLVTGGGPYDFGPSPELTADILAWINDPLSNHGWLLKSENETSSGTARHFGSSESPQPPRLLLGYSTPAPRPVLTNPRLAGGAFTFQFDGTPGWIYRVESQTGLNGAWNTVTNAEAGAATSPVVITAPLQLPGRFYRVLAE